MKTNLRLFLLCTCLFVTIGLAGCESKKETIQPPELSDVQSSAQKQALKAIANGTVPNFSSFQDVKQKKAVFFEYFYALLIQANKAVLAERQTLKSNSLNSPQIQKLCKKYRVDCGKKGAKAKLQRRIDIVPPSLVLAQAANESAWGTSRFAKQGNNYFGQWCFKKGCGMVPQRRKAGATHEVKTFSSPAESVQAYIFNLNTTQAYQKLREIRAHKRQQNVQFAGAQLAQGLLHYSERGEAYIQELQSMMRHNHLNEYDQRFWAQIK